MVPIPVGKKKLTNVGFLSTLSSVETLEIKFCKFLTDYSGFKRAVESGGITESIWNEELFTVTPIIPRSMI